MIEMKKICGICNKKFNGHGNSKYCSDECRKTASNNYDRKRYDPYKNRNWKLKRNYNISQEDYDKIYEKQGGKCAICEENDTGMYNQHGKIEYFCVDHNHKTGEIRGLLCSNCNTAIGLLKHDPAILAKAIKYIEGFT